MELQLPPRSYKYLDDRPTAPELKGAICQAITVNGKCIRRGASIGVVWKQKARGVARLLRKQRHHK